MKKLRKRLSSFQIILLGFAGVILIGALILMLPISTKERIVTPFIDAIFTSTSAVCVTGLIVFDTATHWSIFGQVVIITLIQIGGIGVITIAVSFALLFKKKIGLSSRGTLKEAISAEDFGGVLRLMGFILKGIFLIEFLGAVIMLPVFCRDFGPKGIWYAFFHSISAFCNAGFDLMGTPENKFQSLTSYATNPVINLTVCFLILIGGIGFLVWDDIIKHKWRIKKYRMQSKAVLLVSLIITLFPTIYFFIFEFGDMSFGDRLLASFFQAVTPRTAGFNTVDLTMLKEVSIALMIILMMIGGSSGSTAGGMKMTTVSVLFASALSVFRKKDSTEMLKRRIDDDTVKTASAIMILYLVLFLVGGMTISLIEDLPLLTCLYESASAVATVGLTLGITSTLSIASKIILIVSMYFGRVGAMTLIYATVGSSQKNLSKYPIDKISVG
ncbi:MAG: Trk family potassium uptake protein [Clostridia bacterium]|nr:Trk family potassium uptake protein [Clostridia bacterium]